MIKRYIFSTVIVAIAVALLPAKLLAADIPCSTAKLIVPWKAGGGTDIIFRVVVDGMNKGGIKPPLQVVNITGQGGNKGAKEARAAKPDGCTLFAMHQSAITSFFSGRVDFTWDAFEPVAMVTNTPSIIGANKDVPYNDVKDLITAAKAKPQSILAGGTLGSTSQFIFLLLEDAANVKFKHISYDGTRERMTALLAKNIELGEINVTAAQKYIKTNELKALGIATPERDTRVPNVKTLKEQGIDLVFGLDRGVMAPKGTPGDVIKHYEAAILKATSSPEVVGALEAKGSIVRPLGTADYRKHLTQTYDTLKATAIKVGIYKP
jgi:tripartite-type tricarboxylate transporter receptor subunit TctC